MREIGDVQGRVLRAIVLDAENAYFATTLLQGSERNTWAVIRAPKNGRVSKIVAQREAPISALAADETNLYWANGDGEIRVAPKSGKLPAATRLGGRKELTGLVVTPTSIVFAEGALREGQLVRLPK
jgi:hypothetical protein